MEIGNSSNPSRKSPCTGTQYELIQLTALYKMNWGEAETFLVLERRNEYEGFQFPCENSLPLLFLM